MSSTQATFPRSPLTDAFSSLLNNSSARNKVESLGSMSAAAAAASSSSSEQQQQYPMKSSSSTLRPPSSETTAVPPSRTFQQRNPRPLSEVIRPDSYISPESKFISHFSFVIPFFLLNFPCSNTHTYEKKKNQYVIPKQVSFKKKYLYVYKFFLSSSFSFIFIIFLTRNKHTEKRTKKKRKRKKSNP